MKRASRTVTIGLGHACCTGVLCAHGRRADAEELERLLRGGGRELVVRGAHPKTLAGVVQRARRAGFADVVLATAELDRFRDDPELVRASGIDAVRAIVFSPVPSVHDRLAGRDGALSGALFTARALSRAGLPVEIEAPLSRVSDPFRVVDLAMRAFGALRAVRFAVPGEPHSPALAPPRFDAIRDSLARAIERAGDARVRFDPSQGIPPCALPEATHHARFTFRHRERSATRELAPACSQCAVAPSCSGPTRAYLAAHGDAGLSPFASRPRELSGKTRTPRPSFGARERQAAREARLVVLRPTVHCNQDCLFCSANESSKNAFADPKTMLKAIARAAQRGAWRVSFSGGEPTLSPHLSHFVRAARRCGVAEVELVTNGVLLDKAPKVKRLAEAGLTHAFVSLHAHTDPISRTLTQKEGDHARTLSAIGHFLDAGVVTAINHVITTRNEAYLSSFVEDIHRRFGGAVLISFAFVTPQFQALEHPELWPRLSDVRPHLVRAMHRALELGQPFVVGSRQGVPPCMLDPFAAWSDVFVLSAEAASEDAPQKIHGPVCERCRYRSVCTGVWRPYAARFGTDELTPIEGPAFTPEELAAIRAHPKTPPWGLPRSFEEAPPILRNHDAERAPPPPLSRTRVSLPVRSERTRPLRVLLIGSGPRARRLAERAMHMPALAIAAVASPHAPDAPGWAPLPLFRDAREAIEEARPDAAIIAAATEAHVELARVCIDAGLPTLLEKPVARTASEACSLAGWVSCAFQELFEPGLEALAETAGPFLIERAVSPNAPDAPRAWGRAPLFETLHHALALAVRARGPLAHVQAAHFDGAARPELVRLFLSLARGEAELRLDFRAARDELALHADGFRWRRNGAAIEHGGRILRGSGEERMLAAFQRAVITGETPPVPLAEGVLVIEATEAILVALEERGAPFSRPSAPKHVVSPRYRIARGADKA